MSQDDVLGRIDKLEKWAIDMLVKMDQVRESMLLYCDGQDAVNTQLRRNIGGNPFKAQTLEQKVKEQSLEVKLSYNVDALKWELRTPKEEGKKPYEITQDDGSENFKNLVKAVYGAGEKGMFTKFGQYWVMFEGKAVGRRARK
jgi:hypothetical protein